MIKSAFFLSILISATCLLSCNEPHKSATVVTSADYKKGESFYDANNDSAFFYFNNATTTSADSLEIAMAYSYMGIIQSGAGDYFGSQESLLQSLKHLDEKKEDDRNCLLSNFNELGRVSLDLKNYDASIAYYDKALQFIEDDNTKIIVLSNKAVAYQKKQQYAAAISIYDPILHKSKTDQKRYARILSNMAFTKWLQDSTYNAAPELLQALYIQENKKDNWGLNASYAHLSAYYFYKDPATALLYAVKMYNIAKTLNSPDDELEALQKIITLNAPGAVKNYFNRFQYLSDSLQTARNNAKNQFALIRYDAAKNKADNLSLQKDNAVKRFQILLQWIIIASTIVVAGIIFQWLKKRRRQMLQEQQLKTSQKVHDVVANGLYRLMAKVEYEEEPDKEMLLDDIEILYEQSRNIAHEQSVETTVSYCGLMTALLSSFGADNIRVSIVGNSEELWQDVSPKIKKELNCVLQELMVNMKKHSAAGNVVIRFGKENKMLNIHYTDDGKGLPMLLHYKNGLRNTENRIAGVGGNISFENSTPKGLKIQLSVPIA